MVGDVLGWKLGFELGFELEIGNELGDSLGSTLGEELGCTDGVQVMTRLSVPELLTATKIPSPYATPAHWLSVADIRLVHTMPLGDVMTRLSNPGPQSLTATKM